MSLFLVAGARTDFMKLAPIYRALSGEPSLSPRLVQTGSKDMWETGHGFYGSLGLSEPHFILNAGGRPFARQTARVMPPFEDLCREERPRLVMVAGDADPSVAAALTARKLGIRVAHVEAGLRSFDRTMPDEVNRLAIDAVSDLFFVTESQAMVNLKKEGKPGSAVHFVGNVLVDTLYYQLRQLGGQLPDSRSVARFKDMHPAFGLISIHDPSTVEDPGILSLLMETLGTVSRSLPLIFPVHPDIRTNMETFGIRLPEGISRNPPLDQLPFLSLWKDARLILTDSRSLQEGATILGIPCLALGNRPSASVTLTRGTNQLVGTSPRKILQGVEKAMAASRNHARPDFWDGRAARRIAELIRLKEFKLR